MKRSIVVLGVLAAFFLTLTGAYAVENATWGRIKATFDSPSMASGDLQLLPDEAFPSVSAKPVKGGVVTKRIKAEEGGTVSLDARWAKMKIAFEPGALSGGRKGLRGDILISLSITRTNMREKRRIGRILGPKFEVNGRPHRTSDPAAKLTIIATVLSSYLPDPGSLTLAHQTGGGWKEVKIVKVEVEKQDKKYSIVRIEADCAGFSRYALARCR